VGPFFGSGEAVGPAAVSYSCCWNPQRHSIVMFPIGRTLRSGRSLNFDQGEGAGSIAASLTLWSRQTLGAENGDLISAGRDNGKGANAGFFVATDAVTWSEPGILAFQTPGKTTDVVLVVALTQGSARHRSVFGTIDELGNFGGSDGRCSELTRSRNLARKCTARGTEDFSASSHDRAIYALADALTAISSTRTGGHTSSRLDAIEPRIGDAAD
jgi:hypothetical protein